MITEGSSSSYGTILARPFRKIFLNGSHLKIEVKVMKNRHTIRSGVTSHEFSRFFAVRFIFWSPDTSLDLVTHHDYQFSPI